MTIKDLQLPLSDYKIGKIGQFYTKEEVDQLIKYAVNEAKRIDEESMRKHNREATMISMALGFTTLALFVRWSFEASRNCATFYGYKYKYY